METQFLLLSIHSLNFNVCLFYRPPNPSNLTQFYDSLNEILETNSNTIFFGDSNINLLKDDVASNQLTNIVGSNNFHFLNKVADCMYTFPRYQSLIDHVFCDISSNVSYKFCIGDHPISDHRYVALGINFNKSIISSSARIVNRINYKAITNKLSDIPQTDFDDYHNELIHLFSQNTSEISVNTNVSVDKPWFDDNLKQIKKYRDIFYGLKEKYPLSEFFKNQFIFYKWRLHFEIIKSKKKYYSKRFSNVGSNPKQFWSVLKEILHNKTEQRPLNKFKVKHNNKLFEEDMEVANLFNDHFVSISSNPTANLNSAISNSSNSCEFDLKIFEPTTPDEIGNIILDLRENCSSGFDGINAKFLKSSLEFFSTFLSNKINESFENGTFPSNLKIACVKPLFKGGDASDCNNYRPISLLSIFSKVYEIAIKNRLCKFLEETGFISKYQCGFLKNSSVMPAISQLVNFIVSSLNDSKKTSAYFWI